MTPFDAGADRDEAVAPSPALEGRRLIVRADASSSAGTGHLMRTLALAQAWLDRGGRVRWLLAEAPPALEARVADEGIEIRRLGAPAGSEADVGALRTELEGDGLAAAALDGRAFGADYLGALGPSAGRALLVDDAADRGAYPAGIVLNQNAHADRGAYPVDAGARFLLGTRFALLRREFVPAPPPRQVPERARTVLVTLGGADPAGVTGRVIDALGALPDPMRAGIAIRVVVGAANPEGEHLERVARDRPGGLQVEILRGVEDMPALLAWADLAITSGGSTVWELARMGCPALVIETVPVESLLAGGLEHVGLGDRLGRADRLEDATITAAASARIEDGPWRAAMSELGRRLVDGRGAARVVDALAELAGGV